jgi:GDP-L-fucose synthase
MDKTAKIFIAGHNGMVGSALKREIEKEEFTNFITAERKILDLSRQNEVENFFQTYKPEYVFLGAAKVGGIIANDTYKAEFIYDNLMIAVNIINSAYKSGVKKLLNLGSSCIYPKFANQPMKEDSLLTGALEPTNEPYAIAKIAAIKLCRYYNEQYSTNYISVMPTNLFGINDNYNLETSHVLPAILRKILIAVAIKKNDIDFLIKDFNKNNVGFGLEADFDGTVDSLLKIYSGIGITSDKIKLWGSGSVYREFMYVDDLAYACLFLMNNFNYNEIGEFINIGTSNELTIKELAFIIKEIAEFDGIIEFDNTKPEGPPRKLMDSSKLTKLGWKPKISLEEGIKLTIKNYFGFVQSFD